jgi:hypothetical protein
VVVYKEQEELDVVDEPVKGVEVREEMEEAVEEELKKGVEDVWVWEILLGLHQVPLLMQEHDWTDWKRIVEMADPGILGDLEDADAMLKPEPELVVYLGQYMDVTMVSDLVS